VPKTKIYFFLASCLFLFFYCFTSCNSTFTPKPQGYFKIYFPEHQYKQFSQPGYPYSFEYPVYSNIIQDTSFFESKPENPYWINIDFPQFNARMYISYKEIGSNTFDKLKNDAYKMTFKHSYKATSIEDSIIRTPLGITGIFFNVGGNAATAKQFFVSDSVKHFLRGALYFDTAPNADSLGIVNQFLETDMMHLINTLKWEKQK
jgi:gliding motility-associated lipoprotein GldD